MGWAAGPLVGLEVGHGGLEGEGCHANSRKNVTFFCLMGNLLHLGLDLRVCFFFLKSGQGPYLRVSPGWREEK